MPSKSSGPEGVALASSAEVVRLVCCYFGNLCMWLRLYCTAACSGIATLGFVASLVLYSRTKPCFSHKNGICIRLFVLVYRPISLSFHLLNFSSQFSQPVFFILALVLIHLFLIFAVFDVRVTASRR